MDIWGIGILVVSLILYFVTQKKYTIFLFTAGIGMGLIIAAIWVFFMIDRVFGNF